MGQPPPPPPPPSPSPPPSPDDPPVVVLALDVHDCAGCGQRLTFDARGLVPQHQLDACRGVCDWTLVSRRGCRVEDTKPL